MRLLAGVVTAGLVAGCVLAGGSRASAADDGEVGVRSAGCARGAHRLAVDAHGDARLSFQDQGVARSALVHVPAGRAGPVRPLVMSFDGSQARSAEQVRHRHQTARRAAQHSALNADGHAPVRAGALEQRRDTHQFAHHDPTVNPHTAGRCACGRCTETMHVSPTRRAFATRVGPPVAVVASRMSAVVGVLHELLILWVVVAMFGRPPSCSRGETGGLVE